MTVGVGDERAGPADDVHRSVRLPESVVRVRLAGPAAADAVGAAVLGEEIGHDPVGVASNRRRTGPASVSLHTASDGGVTHKDCRNDLLAIYSDGGGDRR